MATQPAHPEWPPNVDRHCASPSPGEPQGSTNGLQHYNKGHQQSAASQRGHFPQPFTQPILELQPAGQVASERE